MDNQKTLYTLAKHITVTGMTALGITLAPWHLSAWGADGLLHNIRFDQNSRHFVIDTTGQVKAMVNTITIAGRKRVIIDLDNADIAVDLPRDTQLLQDLTAQMPALKNITINQYGGNGRPIVRVLLDLQGEPGSIRLVRNQGPHIELELSDYADKPMVGSRYENPPSLSNLPTPARPQPSSSQKRPPVQPDTTLESIPQPPSYLPAQRPVSQARPTKTVSAQPDNTISREQYNQSLQQQDELKRQIETLRQHLNVLQANQASSNANASQLNQMKHALVNMNQKLEQLQQENDGLKAKLAIKSSSVSPTEMNRMQTQLDTLSHKNAELKTELQSMSSKNSELQNRLTQALSADTGPRIEDMKRNLGDLNQQLAQLRQEKNRQDQQLQQLTQEKASLTQQIAQLKTQGSSKASATGSQANLSSISNSELQELRRQLSVAQQSMNDSLRTIQEQNQEMAYLRNQINNVKAGMDSAAKEQIASLESTSAQKDATIRDLQKKVSEARNANLSTGTSTSTQLSALQAQLDTMTRQHQAEVQELNRQLQEKNAQVSGLRQQVALATAKQPDKLADQSLQQKDQKISELQQSLKQLTQQLNTAQSAQHELDAAKAQLAQLKQAQAQQSNGQGQAAALQKQVTSLQQESANWKKQYEQAVEAAKQAKGKSAPATAGTATASPALQKQINELNQQLAALRRENDDLRAAGKSTDSGNAGAATNPEAEAAYQEGKTNLKAKKMEDALDKFKQALLLDPNNGRYTVDYSIALSDDQQYAEAIDVLRRYLQRNPLDRDAYNQLGKIYLMNDQADAANQAFSRAIPVSTLNNYATSLKKLGRLADAENVFKLALTVNPRDSEVLFNLGNLYNNQNKLELARNKYLEALQFRPDFAEAHYNLGLIFSKMGDNAKAVMHLEKFLQLSPNAKNAETIRAYVQKLKA